KGTGSTIELNLTDDISILTGGKDGKNFIDKKLKFFVGLYHELIHADINARGARRFGNVKFEFKDEFGGDISETVDRVELQDVGLGFNGPADITENQIRAEHKMGLRQAIKYP